MFVRKAMTRAAKGRAETTKTPAGRREVRLLPPAIAALNAQKEFSYIEGKTIFSNKKVRGGDPQVSDRWSDNLIWKLWQVATRTAKVHYRNPYQTRHTFASMDAIGRRTPDVGRSPNGARRLDDDCADVRPLDAGCGRDSRKSGGREVRRRLRRAGRSKDRHRAIVALR